MCYDAAMDRERKWRKNAPLARDKRRIRRLLTSTPIVTMAARGVSRKVIARDLDMSDDAVGKHLNRAINSTANSGHRSWASIPARAMKGSATANCP